MLINQALHIIARSKLRRLVTLTLAAASTSSADPATQTANKTPATQNIDNPIVLQRADPWIHKIAETGCYYFTGTVPNFDKIILRHACRFNDLKLAEETVIWRKHDTGPMSANIWAPELHRFDDQWVIYFAAGDVDNPFSIRMYALTNKNDDPLQGTWDESGKITTPIDSFALDATRFKHNDQDYLIWAQMDADQSYNSALWIAKLKTPTTITGPVTLLSKPDLAWEQQGYKVNEGAAVIIRHNKVIVTYSASATDHRYAMGLLWADINSDLLNPNSWHKSQEPIFQTDPDLNRFGPGHNSFTIAEDGKTDLLIYHARDYLNLRGNPLTDPNRHARARAITVDESGTPNLNAQLAD